MCYLLKCPLSYLSCPLGSKKKTVNCGGMGHDRELRIICDQAPLSDSKRTAASPSFTLPPTGYTSPAQQPEPGTELEASLLMYPSLPFLPEFLKLCLPRLHSVLASLCAGRDRLPNRGCLPVSVPASCSVTQVFLSQEKTCRPQAQGTGPPLQNRVFPYL